MKYDSIKKVMRPYSLVRSRKTSINYYFAQAIATSEIYDDTKVRTAMKMLKMDENDLHCAYCEKVAENWDHVRGVVKDGKFSGYGNVLGNLVPCCRSCNQKKAGKDWKVFMLEQKFPKQRISRLESYFKTFKNNDLKYRNLLKKKPGLVKKFHDTHQQVLSLIEEADNLSKEIYLK